MSRFTVGPIHAGCGERLAPASSHIELGAVREIISKREGRQRWRWAEWGLRE